MWKWSGALWPTPHSRISAIGTVSATSLVLRRPRRHRLTRRSGDSLTSVLSAPTRTAGTQSSRPRSFSRRSQRILRADTMVSTTLPAAQSFVDDIAVASALSGSSAEAHYLGGRNTIADLDRRIVSTTVTLPETDFPAGDEAIILTEDRLEARTWKSGYASLAPTCTDADRGQRTTTSLP